MKLKDEDILGIDVELTNICNLKCPLCLSQLVQTKSSFQPGFIDVDALIRRLDAFTGLEVVSLAGDASEPTLHPRLLDLLDYLKRRPDVKTELYTNASAKDDEWWTELNRHFGENSVVYFTICGSSQALHEKYRVGSKLADVIRHARAFRKGNPFGNDHMQYIKFEYNKKDDMQAVAKILSEFSQRSYVETDPIWERLNPDAPSAPDGVCSERVFSFFYRRLLKQAKARGCSNIQCNSLQNRYVRMDNRLNVYPCVCYMMHRPGKWNMDYSDILGGKEKSCYECDIELRKFLDSKNRDSFYVC